MEGGGGGYSKTDLVYRGSSTLRIHSQPDIISIGNNTHIEICVKQICSLEDAVGEV